MLPEFARTTRSLAADRGPARVVTALALGLLAVGGAWSVAGELTLYEGAASARVSAEGVARLRAPVSGEVTAVPVVLGQAIAAGDLLVQLDDADARLQLAAAEARGAGLAERLAALDDAFVAETAGREAGEDARAAGVGAARGAVEHARERLRQARVEEERVARLLAAGAASAAELETAASTRAAREAEVRGLERELDRAAGLGRRDARGDEAVVSHTREARAGLIAEIAASEAEVARLRAAVADRAVTAPVAGILGELTPLVPGQRVEAGAALAVVVPGGILRVEARFPAERAVGRVRADQPAWVQIHGLTGGALATRRATVLRVGTEPGDDGLVPVTLAFDTPDADLHHGLLAEVAVEVETVHPATLLARAATGAR